MRSPHIGEYLCLRVLLPALLVVTAIANVVLRLLPPDVMAFRSWEAVTLFVTSIGPFATNKHYYNPAATGDLSGLANLPEFRRPHAEAFTTGAHGFRMYDPDVDRPPAALLFGDSFGAGASVSDEACLGARLSSVFKGPVFFAGYYGPAVAESLAGLPAAPLLIVQLSERYPIEDSLSTDSRSLTGFVKNLVPVQKPSRNRDNDYCILQEARSHIGNE